MSGDNAASRGRQRPLRRVVLKEEHVALTGHWRRAMVLNQLLYWSERHHDVDRFIAEEKGRDPDLKLEPTYGWIYKSSKELITELMLDVSDQTLRRDIAYLVEHGWLAERHNPRQKWDRELQYRPDMRAIQRDLQALGYALAGYPLLHDDPESICPPMEHAFSTMENGSASWENGASAGESRVLENAFSTMENGSSILENRSPSHGESKLHGGAAIPESTAETTTPITTETTTGYAPDALNVVVAVLMGAGLTKRQAMDATARHHLTPSEADAWRDWAQHLDPAKTNPAAVLVAALKDQRLPSVTRPALLVVPSGWNDRPPPAPFASQIVRVAQDDGPPELVPLADLWQRVQTGLRQQLPHNDFETWITPAALLAIDDEVAIIGAPNVFVRQELEACYLDLLGGALQAVLRRPVVVRVVIDAVT